MKAAAPISDEMECVSGSAPFAALFSPVVLGAQRRINAGTYESTAAYSSEEIPTGYWVQYLNLDGPFGTAGPKPRKIHATFQVTTQPIDVNAVASTGNLWYATPQRKYRPVTIAPGASTSIHVTFTANGSTGSVVNGTLYLENMSSVPKNGPITLVPNELAAIPYTYKIGS